jgi:hypothetical protein
MASALAADEGAMTLSKLLADGRQVVSVQTSQQWPYFYIIKTGRRMFACSMDYDQGYKFFDYRQPAPVSVSTRCTELK